MSDAFVTLRETLRKQAQQRDALAARYWQNHPAEADTSYSAPHASDGHSVAELEASSARAASGRTVLGRKYRARLASAHGVSEAATAVPQSVEWYQWNAAVAREYRLTHEQRDLIRFIRNSDVRHELAQARVALPADPVALEQQLPTTSRLPRGLVDGREVRVNTRGAYGKRGIRGTMAQVSQRDNRVPSWALRRLDTVGVATHPDASPADYDYLLRTVRADRKASSLRLITADNSTGVIVPAWDYGKPADEAEGGFSSPTDWTSHHPDDAPRAMSDVQRYAHIIGNIGNIE